MKLYSVVALASIIGLTSITEPVKVNEPKTSQLTAKPGDAGFPYFYCDTILESETVFGPIFDNQTTYSGSCHFELFVYRRGITFAVEIYQKDQRYELFRQTYSYVDPGIIKIDYTLTFPPNMVAREPVIIDFYCDNHVGDYVAQGQYQLKTLPRDLVVEDYLEQDFIADGYAFQLGKEENIKESFHFEFPKDGLFLDDRYYRLNLDFLYFRYQGEHYDFAAARLNINDKNDLFPYLPIDVHGKYIPFTLKKDGDIISIKLLGQMYVEPNTLTMSFEYREGFVKSNYFYLPKNKADLFNGYEFVLRLYQLGAGRYCFSYHLTFNVGYFLLGDCINSDYCLAGTVND